MRNYLLKHRASLFAFAILGLLMGICAVRSLYGFDWSDETYYVALPYRFLLGDAPFTNAWDLHQLAAFFTVPLLRLYLAVSGSADGSILFFRLSYVLFTFVTSIFAYCTLRKRFSYASSLTVSALLLVFAHFAIGSFSYDTQVILFAALSVLFLIRADTCRRNRINLVLAGLFYAFAVQSYPQFVVSVPLAALFFWFQSRRSRLAGMRRGSPIWFAAGVGAAILLFFSFLLAYGVSPRDLITNIPYFFMEPAHQYAESRLRLFLNYGHTLLVVFGYVAYLVVGVTAAALFVRLQKNETLKVRLRRYLTPCVLVCGLLGIVRILTYGRVEAPAVMNFLAMPLAIIYPALYLLEVPEQRSPHAPLLFGFGLSLSLAIHLLSSNMLIRASSFPMILCSFASILSLPGLEAPKLRRPRCTPVLSFLLCAALALSVTSYRIIAVYRDDTLPNLDTVIADGPLSGIRTTVEKANVYASILADVQKNVPETGTILFSYVFPFGYLMTDLRPAAPSVWSADFNVDERLGIYYKLHPELAPDCIVVLPEGVGISPSGQDVQNILDLLPEDADYRRIDCAYCTIYLSNNSAQAQ